jgi:hypothetical protein
VIDLEGAKNLANRHYSGAIWLMFCAQAQARPWRGTAEGKSPNDAKSRAYAARKFQRGEVLLRCGAYQSGRL